MTALHKDENLTKSDGVKDTIGNNRKELLLKFLVLGDFGVGKTSIIKRYCEGLFLPSYKITIGADFCIKRLLWDNDTVINIQLWDIAGHERFGHLTRVYYKYAVAAIIVFDLTRNDTLESVEKWLTDLRQKVLQPNGDPIPVILLANKADVNFFTNVPKEKIVALCEKFMLNSWYITSAKDNTNINEALHDLVSTVLQNKHEEHNNNGSIVLRNGQVTQSDNASGCCS